MLRVVQWTTGNVGRWSLRAILEHPSFELVGVFAHSPEKVGQDAGDLCGLGPAGIRATDDRQALVDLAPDCVVYQPMTPDIDELDVLLRAGINVVSTAGFLTGRYFDGGVDARIDDAAREGGASFYGTGVNPGYVNALSLVLASACSRVTSLRFRETADCTTYAAPEMWRVLGFGEPPPPPGTMSASAEALTSQFDDAIDLMATALDVSLDRHERAVRYAVATEDIELPWMTFPKGTVAGQWSSWRGLADERAVFDFEVVWRMGDPLDLDLSGPEGYHIMIAGEPELEITWTQRFGDAGGANRVRNYLEGALLATAMAAVNAIPVVCAAPPGLRTFVDLPLVTASGRVWPRRGPPAVT
jgi:hypothetical protein